MRLEHIEIENRQISWGMTIRDLKLLFSDKQLYENENKFSRSKTLRFKIDSLWGINCNSCEFSSPSYDRLINRFQIYLGPMVMDLDSLMNTLDGIFGQRISDSRGENRGSGSVIRNCQWKFDNCDAGVSIYGSERMENGASNSGMLYFYLTDLKLIHKLYSPELIRKSQILESHIAHTDIDKKIFRLSLKQKRYWDHETKNYPGFDVDYISMALNGLFKRDLLNAPSVLRNLLKENEICIFKDPVTSESYIANKRECCSLSESKEVYWHNMLPAKGSGFCTLSIGSFRIDDEHSRPETEGIIRELEKILNLTVECHEDYDC